MNHRKLIFIGFVVLFFDAAKISAQDVSFSQFFSNPLYLNPAFAGSMGVPRLALQYRNQWQGFGDAFSSYNAAFDFSAPTLQGGVGIFLLKDAQAGNSLNSLQVNAAYSVFVRVSSQYRLHGAIQAGIHQNRLDPGKLIFADNLDPYLGNQGVSGELAYFPDFQHTYPDFSAGLLLYSRRNFGGVALHHLTEPRLDFYEENTDPDRLSRKYTAHFGSRWPVYLHGQLHKRLDVSPQVVMQFQDNYGQMNYGMFASMQGFTAGGWFRQNFGLQYDAVILLLGFAKNQWQINYSYDMVVSGLWGQAGGTSEISLVFLLKSVSRESYLPFYHFLDEGNGFQ